MISICFFYISFVQKYHVINTVLIINYYTCTAIILVFLYGMHIISVFRIGSKLDSVMMSSLHHYKIQIVVQQPRQIVVISRPTVSHQVASCIKEVRIDRSRVEDWELGVGPPLYRRCACQFIAFVLFVGVIRACASCWILSSEMDFGQVVDFVDRQSAEDGGLCCMHTGLF